MSSTEKTPVVDTVEVRMQRLKDAMEAHGNDAGTETQLGDAMEFFEQLFGMCPPELQEKFLASEPVVEFVERELPADGD